MDCDLVKATLIEVIGKIQTAGGYTDGVNIGDDTVPLDGLEGFDSKLAPIATRRLARELGIEIPKRQNIFREGGRSKGRKLSVVEIAAGLAADTSAITLTQVAQ
jgi:hypothetical protein